MKNLSKTKLILSIILIGTPIIILIYLLFRNDLLLPKGYDLAINGFVISRNMVIIATLFLISKLGYKLLEK